MFKKLKIFIYFFFLIPLFTEAAAAPIGGNNFKELVYSIIPIANNIIKVLIMFALLVFLWGIAKFIRSAGNPEAKEEGKQKMIYGVVGLFIIVSIWGLIGILKNTFGV